MRGAILAEAVALLFHRCSPRKRGARLQFIFLDINYYQQAAIKDNILKVKRRRGPRLRCS